jgi:hypothetical protein
VGGLRHPPSRGYGLQCPRSSSDEPRALALIGFVGLLYDAHLLATDPKTGLTDGARRRVAKAMNYVANHRTELTKVGAKNWLYCGSDDGAHALVRAGFGLVCIGNPMACPEYIGGQVVVGLARVGRACERFG